MAARRRAQALLFQADAIAAEPLGRAGGTQTLDPRLKILSRLIQ
jgi:hypothetical protein